MPSLQSHLLVAFLRLIRRKRIYSSVRDLHASIEQIRRAGPASPSASMRRRLAIEQYRVAGVPVYRLAPRGNTGGRPVLYLHGGAYVRPITRHHWQFLVELVERTGHVIHVPLYPLAPEADCRQVVAAALSVYRDLCERERHPALPVMGDSTGGGLALALCYALREQGLALPARLVLICPWLDVRLGHADIAASERRDPMLAAAGLREAGRLYAGELGVDHPHVSPIEGDVGALPSMLLVVGARDIAHHDALLFLGRARSAGVDIELVMGGGMVHVWPLLPIPEARQVRECIARYLGDSPGAELADRTRCG